MTQKKDYFKHVSYDLTEELISIKTPKDFYNVFLYNLKEANEVLCTSLYFGSGQKCEELFKIMQNRKVNNKKTLVVVDKNRTTGSKSFNIMAAKYNVLDLFYFYDPKVSFSFFLPKKIQELFSVLHSKIYIFDNKILFTGANLDDSYFERVIDRYIITENKNLSQCLKYFIESQMILNISNKKYKNLIDENNLAADTQISPFTQNSEIEVLTNILSEDYDEIYISTGYLNFAEEHISIFKDKKINVIMSIPKPGDCKHTKINFINKIIGEGYVLGTKKAIEKLKNAKFFEYLHDNAKFHVKGLWCFRNAKENQPAKCVTIIGSSNFNIRSIKRDFETNFFITTSNSLRFDFFQKEILDILQNCKVFDIKDIKKKDISIFSKIGYHYGKRFL